MKVLHIIYLICALSFGVTTRASVLGVPGENHMGIGIYIYDIAADTAFDYQASKSRTPASVMKSFTTASAMTLLGRDYRFRTTAQLEGTRQGDVFRGILRITGGGDPTLESDNFRDNKGFCDSIATFLKRQNISHIVGDIAIDDNLEGAGPLLEWEIDDVPWAYGTGLHGLNWRDNICSVWPVTGRTEPHVPGLKIERKRGGATLERGMGSEILYVNLPRKAGRAWQRTTTVPYPYKVLRHELIEKLRSQGIGFESAECTTSSEVTPLYTHVSPPLYDILKSLMLRSDNMFAEGILRAFDHSVTRDSCVAQERELWTQRGLDFEGVNIIDGSGLARANYLPPKFIADMLLWMARSPMGADYLSMFPVAGESGTLRNFMKDTPLHGRLAMKTGSMNGVQTYAGYALGDDGAPTHVVVVFVNQMSCSRARLREGIANLLLQHIPHNSDNPTQTNE